MDDEQLSEMEQNLQNVLSSLIEALEAVKKPQGGINEIRSAVESLKKIQDGLMGVYESNNEDNKEVKMVDGYSK